MSSQQDIDPMRNYLRRLASFRNVGHLLERRDGRMGHFAILLARDGFFHRANNVVCVGCGRETSFEDLRNLGEPFCCGATQVEDEDMTYNAASIDGPPTDSLDDLRVKLKSDPDFSHLATRLNSFEGITLLDWGQTDQLARHGLYYTGVGDTLRCFQCNLHFQGVFNNGVEVTLQTHRRDSPSCT